MSGLDNMRKRMLFDGNNGATSDDRNVKGKLNSFRSALQNSYQAENITFNNNKYRCLINPDKLKTDYDQKEISIDFSSGMKNGSTFYWDRTNSHWIVYEQRLEEEAYFRAQIRRCDYQIEVNGNPYWIYLRGPVETALIWRQKHQIQMNDLNYSILFYIEKNEDTLNYFNRLQVVKFDGHNWRVAATDKYSQDGLIEVYLEEYFDNKMEDAMIEPEVIDVTDTLDPYIDGPQIVRPYDTNLSYTIVGLDEGEFVVSSSKAKITSMDDNSCLVEITTGKSGNFTLTYKKDLKVVNLDVLIKSF